MNFFSLIFALFAVASVCLVCEARPKETDWSSERGPGGDVIYLDDFTDHGCTEEKRKVNLLHTCRMRHSFAPAGVACFHTGMDPTMYGNRLEKVPLDSGCGTETFTEIDGMVHSVCCQTHACIFRCVQNNIPEYRKLIDEFPDNFYLVLNATLTAGLIRKEAYAKLETAAKTSDFAQARKELSDMMWTMYRDLPQLHDMLYSPKTAAARKHLLDY